MATAKRLTTVLSSKGQLVLPKSIREQRRWHPGTQLLVENTAEGVLLKAEPVFPVTDPRHVFASLRHKGRPKTLDQMQAGIAKEARRRHARNRY
jgi:AbrB family looped-hinge helix DNA binding protein